MKAVLGVAIAALCLLAAAGIVIVVAGDLDKTAGKVVYTTALVPIYFSAAYVQGSLLGRGGALPALGWLGVLVSLAGLVAAVYLIWHANFDEETPARVWGSLLVATIGVATFALLLRRRQAGERGPVSAVLFATLGATVVLAGLLIYLIATAEGGEETLARVTGVAAIAWVLGIVSLPFVRAAFES
jgi:uncharacterized membrane protein